MSSNTPSGSNKSCPCKNLTWSLSSFTAAEFGDVTALTRALSKNKNASSYSRQQQQQQQQQHSKGGDSGGITPLHLAAQHGHVAATWLLLEQGHPVDGLVSYSSSELRVVETNRTCTPLHRASFSGAISTIKLLLEKQATLLARDGSTGDHKTPLHKAAAGGRYLAVALLLDALREKCQLHEGLSAVDRTQQTSLQIAQYYQTRQEEERQSVARWDVVAGGVADWDKCVSLLSEAAREVEADNKSDLMMTDSSKPGDSNTTKTTTTRLSAQLPSHRFAEVDCLDCEENGECVTATWSAAFQKALQQSISIPPAANDDDNGRQADETANNKALAEPKQEPDLTEERIGIKVVTLLEVSETPEETMTEKDDETNRSSSMGRACALCGKEAIVLFPSSSSNGDLLVCKKCKPRRRR